jgi:hypothetical protein
MLDSILGKVYGTRPLLKDLTCPTKYPSNIGL